MSLAEDIANEAANEYPTPSTTKATPSIAPVSSSPTVDPAADPAAPRDKWGNTFDPLRHRFNDKGEPQLTTSGQLWPRGGRNYLAKALKPAEEAALKAPKVPAQSVGESVSESVEGTLKDVKGEGAKSTLGGFVDPHKEALRVEAANIEADEQERLAGVADAEAIQTAQTAAADSAGAGAMAAWGYDTINNIRTGVCGGDDLSTPTERAMIEGPGTQVILEEGFTMSPKAQLCFGLFTMILAAIAHPVGRETLTGILRGRFPQARQTASEGEV